MSETIDPAAINVGAQALAAMGAALKKPQGMKAEGASPSEPARYGGMDQVAQPSGTQYESPLGRTAPAPQVRPGMGTYDSPFDGRAQEILSATAPTGSLPAPAPSSPPAQGAQEPAQEPPAPAGAPEAPVEPGAVDEALADALAHPSDVLTPETVSRKLAELGLPPSLAETMGKTLSTQSKRATLRDFLRVSPAAGEPVLPSGSQAGAPAGDPGVTGAGSAVDVVQGLEAALQGSILEDGAREAIVQAVRGVAAQANQSAQEAAQARAEAERLRADAVRAGQGNDQAVLASAQRFAEARRQLVQSYPALGDAGVMETQVAPMVAAIRTTRPDLDEMGLLRAAAGAVFQGQAGPATPAAPTSTAIPSPGSAPAPAQVPPVPRSPQEVATAALRLSAEGHSRADIARQLRGR